MTIWTVERRRLSKFFAFRLIIFVTILWFIVARNANVKVTWNTTIRIRSRHKIVTEIALTIGLFCKYVNLKRMIQRTVSALDW